MFTIAAFGLYTTAVTTLAGRRRNLFLAGLLLPVTVLAVVAARPADVLLLVPAILAMVAMMVALGPATAGLTNSPEHAQVTTLPVSLGVIAVAGWVVVEVALATRLFRWQPRR